MIILSKMNKFIRAIFDYIYYFYTDIFIKK